MVMSSDPMEVQVPSVGRIGYLKRWADDPTTWDAYLDWPDSAMDELVCNGGNEHWCRYELTRRYLECLMNGMPSAYDLAGAGIAKRRPVLEKEREILACIQWMGVMLEAHFQHVRREAARIEREIAGKV